MALLTTTSSGITPQFQKYLDKNILEHAVQALVLDQFALRKPFPKGMGATSIRFFRANVGDGSQVLSLTEGVTPTTYREITWTPIDATLAQYGEISVVSDILEMTALLDTAKQITTTQGEDAALAADATIRNSIIPNITGTNKHYSGASSFATLSAPTPAQGCATMVDVLDAMTTLDIARAPKINGEYVMVAPPQVIRDLMNDSKVFIPAANYGTKMDLYKGEMGTYYGVRVVKTTKPWIENGANTGSENTEDETGTASNKIYASIITGQNAYGTPVMAGNSPFSPSSIVSRGADKADPLNQRTFFAWKSFWTSLVLNPAWIVILRSKSNFSY